MSCFNEEWERGHFGFRVKKLENGQFENKMGNTQDRIVDSKGDMMDIAVVKDGTKFTVYVDGHIAVLNDEWTCLSYSGSFLIDCHELSSQTSCSAFPRQAWFPLRCGTERLARTRC